LASPGGQASRPWIGLGIATRALHSFQSLPKRTIVSPNLTRTGYTYRVALARLVFQTGGHLSEAARGEIYPWLQRPIACATPPGPRETSPDVALGWGAHVHNVLDPTCLGFLDGVEWNVNRWRADCEEVQSPKKYIHNGQETFMPLFSKDQGIKSANLPVCF
jgi:hypothetical protein